MRAVVMREFGPPEVLEPAEVDEVRAGPDEVVIDVELANVTFVETQVRAGKPPHPSMLPALPAILGNGVGGTVAGAGSGVEAGRRVVASLNGTGGYAERVAVPTARLIEIPDGMPLRDAVALLADGRTALALAGRAGLRAGDTVLVEAAAGGVGTLLVQLARNAGARVVALAGQSRKLAIARDLGADLAVDYSRGRLGHPGSRRRSARWTWCSTASAGTSGWRRSACSPRAAGSARSAWPAGGSPGSRQNSPRPGRSPSGPARPRARRNWRPWSGRPWPRPRRAACGRSSARNSSWPRRRRARGDRGQDDGRQDAADSAPVTAAWSGAGEGTAGVDRSPFGLMILIFVTISLYERLYFTVPPPAPSDWRHPAQFRRILRDPRAWDEMRPHLPGAET